MKKSSVGGSIGRAGLFLLLFVVITGIAYTLVVTGISQLFFPKQANGSVIEVDGKTYGSELLAQQFTKPEYLWGRPMNLDVSSFTDEEGNPVMYAWATNKTPAGEEEADMVKERIAALQAADPTMKDVPIPVDLVTVSGSGLDPAISPEAAEYQVHRVAEARGISEDEVREAIEENTTQPLLGIFGNPAVNVLKVNLTLDGVLGNE